ncbi:rhomboid family intramembrane serine protease [Halopseudomonas phragmitis]|uniref:Rhomboid family intramembrane serine protease n=1 Tax=Halopseudomonas phragmitis TaxID=1931241 RepID=A0A1V0B107_9GAMM|nr:rhomboid family intramembrane serine protease [Halopseudomonas phragmitis]AQZ93609.1 rhomboid family intramembrane serine protease [Halopseudomonas phragmitis]
MPLRKAHCPCCLTRTLYEVPFQSGRVFQCRSCEGMWFEDRQLNQAISDTHPDIDQHCHVSHLGEHLGASQRVCWHCQAPMEHYHLLPDYQVEIDRCASCDGVWLDHDEVDQVMHSPKLKDAMQMLNATLNWRSWLFEFMTRMPVEFNIKTRRTPWVTYSLIGLCALVFLLGQSSAQMEVVLMLLLGVQSDLVGQPPMLWQLLSYQFVHGGWMHLLGNMYFLWIIGDNIEDVLGPWRYLGLYLLGGVIAALAELLVTSWLGGRDLLLVGASGSIATLFGLYLIWFRYSSLSFMFVVWQKKLAPHWFFLIWSGMNIFGMMVGETNVAYAAHLGGFAFGLLAGLALQDRVEAANPLVRMLNAPEARLRR